MIDEFLNSAQSEYDSLKAHCDFIERENRALKKEIEMCDKKIDKLRVTRDKAIEYIEGHKCVIKHYEPYGTPTGLPNYETCDIKGYYKLLDILKEVE